MPTKATADGRKPGQPTQAQLLLEIAEKRFVFYRDENGEPFAIRKLPGAGNNLSHVAIAGLNGQGGISDQLSDEFMAKYKKPPTANALAEARGILRLRAHGSEQRATCLRVGRADNMRHIWIDIGDRSERVIRVSPGRWDIVARSPIVFRRTAATRALNVDKSVKGNIKPLRRLFNVSDGAWDFLINWLVVGYVPSIPHAMPILLGGAGRGKTTLCKMLMELIDPSSGALSGDTENIRDLQTHASGSWVLALENLSSISRQTSDLLSRLITGHEHRERLLYTNSDIKISSLGRRVVILNGIGISGIRPDLQDRGVNINLQPISTSERKKDEEIDAAFEKAEKAAISYLLDTLAAALAIEGKPAHDLDEMPRMADFAQWLHYVDVVRGTRTLEGFSVTVRRDAIESATEHPLAIPLQLLLTKYEKDDKDKRHKTGYERRKQTAAKWLHDLNDYEPTSPEQRKNWPSSARGFTADLRMIGSGLELAGWTVEASTGTGGTVLWTIEPAEPVEADI